MLKSCGAESGKAYYQPTSLLNLQNCYLTTFTALLEFPNLRVVSKQDPYSLPSGTPGTSSGSSSLAANWIKSSSAPPVTAPWLFTIYKKIPEILVENFRFVRTVRFVYHLAKISEAPKTRKRSTQDSKTKHPKLENEAPKSRNHCTLKDNNLKPCMTQAKPVGGNGCVCTSKGPPIQIRKLLCLPIFRNITEITKWPIVRATEMHLQHLVFLLE